MVGVPAKLALSGEHIRSSGHPAPAAQRGQDVHTGRQELEGDHEEGAQVSQLYQVRDTPRSVSATPSQCCTFVLIQISFIIP